ncbi:MAG TPA: hypothetical protein VLD57_09715, partial [Blastocatellia bacterium]|nr:hypothetical protein [Blastocatellia bacterium]
SIPLLREGINSLKSGGDFTFYYAAWDSLATAFEHDGDLLTSLSVLEEGCREKHYGGSANMLWLGMKARLAQMYRRLNRTDDARKVEAELAALLRYADADHPVLRQIQMEQSKEMSGHRRKPV